MHDYFLNVGEIVHEALAAAQQRTALQQYSAGAFLDVFPMVRTRRTLAGHNMILKYSADGFYVGVRLDTDDTDDRPLIPPGADFRLAFALRVSEPRFFNFTALSGSTRGFYQFGNDTGNETLGSRFLSLPIPAYDAARVYEASEVYTDTSDATVDLFRAIRDTGPVGTPAVGDWERIPTDTFDPSVTYPQGAVVLFGNLLYRAEVNGPGNDLNNAADWDQFATLPNQYVTAADRVELRPALFNLDLTGAAIPQVTVRLTRSGTTSAAFEATYTTAVGNLEQVQIDAQSLQPGRYRLQAFDGALALVAGFDFDLYLDSEAVREGWFGVIEIGSGSGDSALLDAGGALRSPSYTLRFLNRATRWRYIFPGTQETGPGADVIPEDPPDNRILVTDQPRSLTRYGTGARLRADDAATPTVSEEVLLPEPEVNRIRRQNSQWFSEIHIPNFPTLN